MARRKSAVSMTLDTRGFTQAINGFLRNSGQPREEAAMALLLQFMRLLILNTPVRAGRARGGWAAGAEAAGFDTPMGGSPEFSAEEWAKGRAQSEYRIEKSGSKIRLITVNNVEYIEALENGHSKQAPFGMLRIAKRELQRQLTGRSLPREVLAVYEKAFGMHFGEIRALPRSGSIRGRT